jgi:hypothetical protein
MVSRNIVPTGRSRTNPPTPPPPPTPSPVAPRAGGGALTAMGGTGYVAPKPAVAPVARYVPSYASPAATARQESINTAAGVNRTPTITTPTGRDGDDGGGGADQVATRSPQLSDFAMDYRDPEYNAQIASLQRALQDFETGAQQRAERYGIDYLQGVRNIGYRPDPSFVAMPNILEMAQQRSAPRAITGAESDEVQLPAGEWDYEGQFNPFSAAARGTRGTRDEFAGRGTLRSSDFAQNYAQFQNRLLDQLGAMETGRTRFTEDTAQELAARRAGTTEQTQAAQRAASARAAQAQQEAYLRALGG